MEYLLACFFRFILWFRYRIKVQGLEKLNPEALKKSGGVLFLPNHPCAFNDPVIVTLAALPRFSIRPLIVEYMYYTPVIHSVMRFMDALPIPNFNVSSNSLKRKRSERAINTVIDRLRHGENFLMYPAGTLKHSEKEVIGGASGVYRVLQEAPEANVVLVRTKGLWGSSFSKYYTGKTPPIFDTIFWGIKECFKNLLFFTPRREVIVEFEPAPADFPFTGTRLEVNRWLENWYNKPDGLSPQQGNTPGDSLILVSYSMWGEKHRPVEKKINVEDENIKVDAISDEVKAKVVAEIAEITEYKPEAIQPGMNLAADLGMDSLDIAEMSAFLQDQFDVDGVPVVELTTVAKVMALASRQIEFKEDVEEQTAKIAKWSKKTPFRLLSMPAGETIPEVFLNNCELFSNEMACGDNTAGALTYSQLKMRVILLAEYIRHLPGEHIGILLPASVGASTVILATQLAGKVPVMVNWTVGPRHLETVLKLSNLQVILSSWAFLDRLENIDLDIIEPYLVMLEDARREFTLFDKLKAFVRSKKSTASILKIFESDKISKDHRAVLLFTSGTESMPKGVPLSHENILTNLRGVLQLVELSSDDVIFGILPPFHAFGFAISGLCGLLCGMRVAYSPDPTDGKRLADGFEKWGITILVGAPLFVKGLIRSARPEQLKTMRLCVTGAEKAPPELYKMVADLGGELLEGYGITECSPVLSMNPIVGIHRGVGKAFPGVELCIVHPETFEELPLNKQGLILARGANVFSGYLNKDVASPFVQHRGKQWYKTGDLGFIDDDGYLTISGRMKRFIKIGGEMISLSAIEEALLQAGLKQGWSLEIEGPLLAVCAKESPGEKPKIYLFSRFNSSVDEINQSLKDQGFSNLVRISSITHLHEIPVMGTGKVNYRALESQYL